MILQIISERGRAKRAVAFADQKFRRIPAVVAADVGVDELAERCYVLIDPLEILVFRFADRVAVAGAHRVDEHEVGFVEQALGVVH